jgi:hypothetical protein
MDVETLVLPINTSLIVVYMSAAVSLESELYG